MLHKCIFLDRDGVLNKERGEYTYLIKDFEIIEGVKEAINLLKKEGYLLIVVTNQGGIAKQIYSKSDVLACYGYLQQNVAYQLDAHYYSPYHEAYSASLSRKPDSLMFEKAMAKYHIDPTHSWMIGDAERDMEAGKKMNLHCIRISEQDNIDTQGDYICKNLWEASQLILDILHKKE